jgi:hypothetical protein
MALLVATVPACAVALDGEALGRHESASTTEPSESARTQVGTEGATDRDFTAPARAIQPEQANTSDPPQDLQAVEPAHLLSSREGLARSHFK